MKRMLIQLVQTQTDTLVHRLKFLTEPHMPQLNTLPGIPTHIRYHAPWPSLQAVVCTMAPKTTSGHARPGLDDAGGCLHASAPLHQQGTLTHLKSNSPC